FFEKIARFRVLIDRFGQRRAKSGQVRAAIRIRDRIGKRQNLVVVAVVVLQHNIDKYFIALPLDYDRLWVQHLFVFTELLNEFFDAVLVDKRFLLRRLAPLVSQRDLKSGIQKRELAQSRAESFELKLGCNGEDFRIGQERDERARNLL